MKKTFLLLISCALILMLNSSFASTLTVDPTLPTLQQPETVQLIEPYGTYYDEIIFRPVQPCYVQVTIIQDLPDGTSTTFTNSVYAYDIEYKFVVFTSNGQYSGVRIALDTYPKIIPVTSTVRPIDFSFTRLTYPNGTNASWGPDFYTCTALGGSYNYSYNSTLHYDIYGNLIEEDIVRTNSTRAYYYVFSGP